MTLFDAFVRLRCTVLRCCRLIALCSFFKISRRSSFFSAEFLEVASLRPSTATSLLNFRLCLLWSLSFQSGASESQHSVCVGDSNGFLSTKASLHFLLDIAPQGFATLNTSLRNHGGTLNVFYPFKQSSAVHVYREL